MRGKRRRAARTRLTEPRKFRKNLNSLLGAEANRLASLLKRADRRLVLAESCTGGMVAATLAGIPGISDYLCGSLVVYRNDSKVRWLKVSKKTLKEKGAVSREVAVAMATQALKLTPEANVAGAITGHLGPLSRRKDSALDGLTYMAVALRKGKSFSVFYTRHRLAPLTGAYPLHAGLEVSRRMGARAAEKMGTLKSSQKKAARF